MLPDCRCILLVRKLSIASGQKTLSRVGRGTAAPQRCRPPRLSPGDWKGGLRRTEALFRGNIPEALGLDPCAIVTQSPYFQR